MSGVTRVRKMDHLPAESRNRGHKNLINPKQNKRKATHFKHYSRDTIDIG